MDPTPEQIDALKEMINIGVGRAGGMLNDLLHSRVNLQVPSIKIASPHEFKHDIEGLGSDQLTAVQLRFKGPFSGKAELIFPKESASKLVGVVMGSQDKEADLDAVRTGVLLEVGNIVINGVMGSIANIISERIHYSIPHYIERSIQNNAVSDGFDAIETLLLAETRFIVEQHNIQGELVLIFEIGSSAILLSAVNRFILELKGTE